MQTRTSQRGFSLVELMITMGVLAVLAAIAYPSMTDFLDRRRLVSQTEVIANLIQLARSEAIKHPTSDNTQVVAVTVDPATWFVGLSNGTGGCTDSATCVLDEGGNSVTRYLTATECTGCTITSPAATTTFVFDLRGIVSTGSADITLQSPLGHQLRISVSTIGRVTLCSPDGSISGYPSTCP